MSNSYIIRIPRNICVRKAIKITNSNLCNPLYQRYDDNIPAIDPLLIMKLSILKRWCRWRYKGSPFSWSPCTRLKVSPDRSRYCVTLSQTPINNQRITCLFLDIFKRNIYISYYVHFGYCHIASKMFNIGWRESNSQLWT
jgi:hypothetical protein